MHLKCGFHHEMKALFSLTFFNDCTSELLLLDNKGQSNTYIILILRMRKNDQTDKEVISLFNGSQKHINIM